jgi:alpha-galactosidase
MLTLWEPHAPQTTDGPTQLVVDGLTLAIYDAAADTAHVADGVVEISAKGEGDVRIEWRIPCTSAVAYWSPEGSSSRWLPAAWAKPQASTLARGSAVGSLIGSGDVNMCSFAALQTTALTSAGVAEESGEFRFWVQASRQLTLRIDTSRRHYSLALADFAAWWAASSPISVPDAARMPAYSTWYSMHQNITPETVERQAALAKDLGCDAIIVDDGWMTTDRTRGYGHCGDWEPISLPDTAAHVQRVHNLGLDYMLWYAIPFIGWDSEIWEEFKPYALRNLEHMQAIVVDPRYPFVREYLAGKLARAVEEWGMDGLKVDFVDWFATPDVPVPGPDADCQDVSEGVEKLLAEIHGRITAANPKDMVEHRQPYISHGLWPYATMIRATDCPLSPSENRQRTVDLRLTSNTLAVHADMLMWHPTETPEQVGVHLINVLFAVPQISVDLDTQSPEQLETLRFWLGVFRKNVNVLQLGTFEPSRPELGYPMVKAGDGDTVVVGRYAALPVNVPESGWSTFMVANADHDTQLVLLGGPGNPVLAVVQNSQGRQLSSEMVSFQQGATIVHVPTGGLITLTKI